MDRRRILALAARLLVAQLFLLGALQKGTAPGVVENLLADRGLPAWLVWPALALNLALAVLLASGWRLREAALVAAGYCAATSVFHLVPGDGWQMSIFVKNWAIAGGCLALAAGAETAPGRDGLRASPSPSPPRPRR